MTDIQPERLVFDDDFDKELIQMWQDNTYPAPSDITRQLSSSLKRLERKIFWRNVVEYAAAAVVLIRSAFDIASGERLIIAPLASIGAALFIVVYIWRKHRDLRPLDATANARAYRTALLERLDRQVRLARSVRYWYVLPCWLFFLAVLVSGVVTELPFLPLMAEFLLATAICIVVIRLNEKYGERKLQAERERVRAITTESNDEE